MAEKPKRELKKGDKKGVSEAVGEHIENQKNAILTAIREQRE